MQKPCQSLTNLLFRLEQHKSIIAHSKTQFVVLNLITFLTKVFLYIYETKFVNNVLQYF